jgi:hypothetical protein
MTNVPIVYELATTREVRQEEEEYQFKKRGKPAVTRKRMKNVEVVIDTWKLPAADKNTGLIQPSHDSTMTSPEIVRLAKKV